MRSPARTAVRYPWLAPELASVAALARGDAGWWPAVRHDPGAVLLVCRFLHSADLEAWTDDGPPPFDRPRLLAFVRDHWGQPAVVAPDAAASTASTASKLARDTRLPNAAAWTAGLLAQLGRRVAPDADAPTAVARRLIRPWSLPGWLAAIIGYADAPAELVAALGVPIELVRVVQSAIASTEPAPAAGPPALTADDVIREYLELAIRSARPDADDELDRLTRAVRDWREAEQRRRLQERLEALAELAAGAGHEINTPLAVIAGRAQYLLARETDPDREQSLRAIMQQARRVSDIFSELMQYARPPRPRIGVVNVAELFAELTAEFRGAAEQRRVHWICEPVPGDWTITADGAQVRTATAGLIRNAIEAAPADGWAKLRAEVAGDLVRVIVEDNGDGPGDAQRAHMFDPFYSGRQAGRGRGLGLSTAWRLAQLNGGDVTFERNDDGPTRFVLALPRSAGGRQQVA